MFPCNKCGLCCKNLDKSPDYSHLDRGDGTCVNFDSQSNLCTIYNNRPLICRVLEYHETHLSHINKDSYISTNISICKKLQNTEKAH
nr:YkgJ family cysteine cluster protein [Pseudomonas cichorii]